MKTIKVSEATGPALDWLVAKCEGRTPTLNMNSHGRVWHGWWLATGGEYERMPNYSTDWSQGGPIIERERIDLNAKINAGSDFDEWRASIGFGALQRHRYGNTPLVAAMRCYVISKLGDTADVPEELG